MNWLAENWVSILTILIVAGVAWMMFGRGRGGPCCGSTTKEPDPRNSGEAARPPGPASRDTRPPRPKGESLFDFASTAGWTLGKEANGGNTSTIQNCRTDPATGGDGDLDRKKRLSLLLR